MAKIYANMNQKGGVAKTDMFRNAGQALSMKGKKTLLVDFDSQVNMTLCCGFKPEELVSIQVTIADLMNKSLLDEDVVEQVKESILNINPNLDLIPGAVALAQVEMLLPSATNRDNALLNIIDVVKNDYEYILIDCGPSLGLLAINALATATNVIIPSEPGMLSIMGMDLVLETIYRVKKRINKQLTIEGILITKVDRRLKSTKKYMDEIHNKYGKYIKVFKTYIPHRAKVKESKGEHMSVIEYSPKSDASVAYIKFVEELLND